MREQGDHRVRAPDRPRFAFPVHDALLSARGRTLYCDHARNFSLDSTELVDLAGGEPRRF
ncbi:hypothetical protein GCM10025862_20010 [Arsenicicoccus piscis]|uniref:Uncharacterized protein n=1 Tax=Arsenicicoccus piscis TaxID=673954 RepID=A0ABQ6HQZ6_9MICO|nr:hypothetical protein GCM10025862_20010 [Arsenicicoccus piscis]